MRLHDRYHLSLCRGARRFQHCADLDRVVAIIVEDDRTIPLAGPREATLHAAEPRKRLADRVHRHAELIGDRDGARRIQRIVMTGHRQHEIFEIDSVRRFSLAHDHVEAA